MLGAGLLVIAVGAGFVYRQRAQPPAEIYRAVPVERRDVARVIEATGHLDARSRYEIPAAFEGRLSELSVKEGDHVKRGQLLARLDARASVYALRNAAAAKDAASWKVTEARTASRAAAEDQSRVERLAQRGLSSSQEVAAAKSAAERAKAALEAARAQQAVTAAQLASTKFEQALAEVVAPIDGVVLVAPENLGAPVTPERALFVIGEPLELMRVDVDVGEADIGEVRVGQRARFQVQAYPAREFHARVQRVFLEPKRDNGVVSYRVLLIADNPDGALMPGMTASVELDVAHADKVLAVREAALRFLPKGAANAPARSRLFRRVGPGQLVAVKVEPGLSDGVYTEVHGDGLSEGDEVAVGLLRPDAAPQGQPGLSLGSK